MKPFKNKLAVTIVVLSVAFLGVIMFSLKKDSNSISSGVGTIISPLQRIIYSVNDKLKNSFSSFTFLKFTKKSNEFLSLSFTE